MPKKNHDFHHPCFNVQKSTAWFKTLRFANKTAKLQVIGEFHHFFLLGCPVTCSYSILGIQITRLRDNNPVWQQLLGDFSALEHNEAHSQLIEAMLTLLDMQMADELIDSVEYVLLAVSTHDVTADAIMSSALKKDDCAGCFQV